jgi:hypothetical protein
MIYVLWEAGQQLQLVLHSIYPQSAIHCVISVIMTRWGEIQGIVVWDGTLDTFTV